MESRESGLCAVSFAVFARLRPSNVQLQHKITLNQCLCEYCTYVTHLDETSHMSAEFVFRYGPKCMGGLILPILVLLHL